MKFLKTIGSRILAVVVLLIIFAAIVGGVALFGLNALTTGANKIIKNNEDLVFVFRAQVKINEMVRNEKDFVLTKDQKFAEEHTAALTEIKKDLEAAKEIVATEKEKEHLEEILDAVDKYVAGFTQITAAVEAGEEEKAQELTQTSSNVLAAEMNGLIGEIVAGREEVVRLAGESANASSKTVRMIEIVALVIAIVVGIILALILVRSTSRVLQDGITRIRDAVALVVDYTKQITTQRQKLDQIVKQVSDSSTNQSKQVEENSKTMTEMSASIQQTATNARTAAETTAKAAELAAKGTEAGKEAGEKLKAIDSVVQGNIKVVKDVDEKADEVTGIVQTINDIADQVNLLALNAAIEAARAGEAGRGFAVVADEVRKLAEQASQATGQISGVVKAVKTAAGTAVEGLETGADQVAESTKVVNSAIGILDQITASTQEITAKAQEISTANQQQTASAQQLTGALQSVASSAEQNSAAAQQATAATVAVAEVVEKAVKQADALTQVTDELQALIGDKGEVAEVRKPVEEPEEKKPEEEVVTEAKPVEKPKEEPKKAEPMPVKPKVAKPEVAKPKKEKAAPVAASSEPSQTAVGGEHSRTASA